MLAKKTLLAAAFAVCMPAANAVTWEALPEKAPVPEDNPMTAEKIELGKQLYFDPRLSATGTVSCNSCHNVMLGGDDNRAVSIGIEGLLGERSAPTVWNSAFYSVQFWDGRAPTLEEQAKGPIINPVEMGMDAHDLAVENVRRVEGYQEAFKQVFGSEGAINIDTIVKAIAAYERTLITPNSPYDRYVKGDKEAMTEQQIRGMETFASVGCVACHSGPNFSGPQMPMGTGFYTKFPTFGGTKYEVVYKLMDDKGRAAVTGEAKDEYMWKVMTLRNIALTAPYFHNGSVKTLEEAVRVMAKTQLNKDLETQQVDDIVAFLNALTGEFPEQTLPRLPGTPGFTLIQEK